MATCYSSHRHQYQYTLQMALGVSLAQPRFPDLLLHIRYCALFWEYTEGKILSSSKLEGSHFMSIILEQHWSLFSVDQHVLVVPGKAQREFQSKWGQCSEGGCRLQSRGAGDRELPCLCPGRPLGNPSPTLRSCSGPLDAPVQYALHVTYVIICQQK